MADSDYSNLDMALVMRDANEELEDEGVLCGIALRKDDLDAFLEDVCKLAKEKYSAALFSELMESDLEDEAVMASFARWRKDVGAY